ncbi:unnamed protein product [Lymnaea stagnalis]|uniref:Caspase-3 n=1 Tax=Lymnaea stagnalis TaxID=6523 RepID=A0AAV2H9K8_LYMST
MSSGDQVDARGEAAGGEDNTDALPRHPPQPSGLPASIPTVRESDFVSNVYKMDRSNLGPVIIFNNKDFHPRTQMGKRDGTDRDADNMNSIFQTMGFQDIQQFNNQTASEMRDKLWKASKTMTTASSCFVCVILTHGEEGFVFGTDDKVPIDDLVLPFKGNHCPALAGKPKIFIIQACRGTELDSGVEVEDSGMEIGTEMDEEVMIRRIPTEADFLMAYSVVPGYFAWRNSANGSWFIQAVYDVFRRHWKDMDLMTMMTRVNKRVAYDFESRAAREFMNRKKQIPCITSMLTKDVYFYPQPKSL